MSQSTQNARNAADAMRLLVVHATSNRRAGGDKGYVALTRRYGDDVHFREMVDTMADAVGSRVVSHGDEEGVVLVSDASSPFAMPWRTLHKVLDVNGTPDGASEKRAHMTAVLLAVAATFYPTPRSQYDPDMQKPTATPEECIETFHMIVAGYRPDEDTEPGLPSENDILGKILQAIPLASDGREDRLLRTLDRQVRKALDFLESHHLLVNTTKGEKSPRYLARERYRLQVAHATNQTAIHLTQLCRQRGEAQEGN